MADPIDTGEKTISGRTIWKDPETGKDYSERSTTFEIDGKFYTMPTVSKDGKQLSEDLVREYVKEYGPIDYITGEKLPVFRYMEDAIEYAISRSNTRKQIDMAKGGVLMKDQMEMSKEGGIADDGMDRDPVSGNEVPSGSLASEVRDDIPAQLSEGEYVVPADVVRYFGVRVFEDMRREAKMGLQQMEQDGRIGGEPIAPEGQSKGLTSEDLAGLEKMLSGSSMAYGGLMDKLEYTVKNDPLVNKIMKEQGSPVAFAEGGVTQALSDNPKEIDETISKFIELARKNPTMMEELAGRGIQVNRTEATAPPKQMQERNSPPETTNPITKKPVEAATGLYATPGASYATSPTFVSPAFGTLGGSQIYQGSTATPFGGQQPAKPVDKVCPPGQIFDEKTQMCVVAPVQKQDDDDFGPPPERDYTDYLDSYGSIDWANPEAFNKYLTDVGTPLSDKEKETNKSSMPGILGALVGTVSPAIKEVDTLAKLKAAELIAQASRNESAVAAAQNQIKTFLSKSGKFVNSKIGQGMAGNGYGFANAIFGDRLKLKGLNINDQKNWTDAEVQTFKDIMGVGKPKPVVKPKRKTPSKTQSKIDASSRLSAQQSKQREDRLSEKEAARDRAKTISDKASNLRQGKGNMTRVQTAAKQVEKERASSVKGKAADAKKKKEDDAAKARGATRSGGSREFGMNTGGLMKRNLIK